MRATITGSYFSILSNKHNITTSIDFLFAVSLAHWLEERQKVYEARQRRVEAICHKNNVSTISSNDTMEDLINFSVHNDSATGMKLLFFTALKKVIVEEFGLISYIY